MHSKKGNNSTERYYLSLFLHSLSFFVLSYLIIYVVSGISTLYIAYDMDIPARLFPSEIRFGIADESPLWTFDAIVSVYMAAPLASLAVGVAGLAVYQFVRHISVPFLFIVIWLFLHAFNQTFGLVSEDLITQTGLTRVAKTMGIDDFLLVLTIGISLFFLFKSGLFAARLFYLHTPEKFIENSKNRIKLLMFAFYLPWFFGTAILFGLAWPGVIAKELILALFMLFILLCMLLVKPNARADKRPFSKPLSWQNIFFPVLMVAALLLFILLLKGGIGY